MRPDAFGTPPSDTPPTREDLQKLQAALDRLRLERADLSKVLADIMDVTAGVRPEKEYGCERCSDCTLQIAEKIESWLVRSSGNRDAVLLQLPNFARFPRALLTLLRGALGDQGAKLDESRRALANQIGALCDLAIKAYAGRRFLEFSRVAAVLSELIDPIEDVFGSTATWGELRPRLGDVESRTRDLMENLPPDSLKEYSTRSNVQRRERGKRVCKGGFILGPRTPTKVDPPPVFVIDFTYEYILGVVREEVRQTLPNFVFLPCRRELPFLIDAFPTRRENEKAVIPVGTDEMKQCGKYYQLFKIENVKPRYYYKALCSLAKPKQADSPELRDQRLLDTYDWPSVPALTAERGVAPVRR
jgi:hypothetical protein